MFRIDHQPARGLARVHCLSDNTRQEFALQQATDIPAMLQAIAQRASTLKGQIQQVFEVTI